MSESPDRMISHAAPRRLIAADRIYDAAASEPPAGTPPDALLVENGRVRALGTRAQLSRLAGDAERIDLPGCTITPGFTDAHIHILEWAFARRQVRLDGADVDEALRRVAAAARSAAPDGWIRGRGWSLEHLGRMPDAALLDRVAPTVPVVLYSHDMHAAWLNTAALERAGLTPATPDPEGGELVRRPDGLLAGVLLERASALVLRALPPVDEAFAAEAVLEAQRELHRLGVTGLHVAVLEGPMVPNPLRVLGRLADAGRLRLRVLQHLPLALLDEAIALGLRSGWGDDWLCTGGIKMFLDGTLGSRTALLAEPYEGRSGRGVAILPAPAFRDAVRRAAAAGLASTVHAIGDAAVGLALDVLGGSGTEGARIPHRIEHVQLAPAGRLADAARAGIVCSMQPSHLLTDWRAADEHWGRQRAARAFACRSLADHGAVLAFGSDAPVDPPDPRLGLFAATERRDLAGEPAGGWQPQERLDRYRALRAYTFGPAYAAGRAGRWGVLAPGAVADLVVWQADPLHVQADDLLRLAVRMTMVAGEVTWLEQ
jgi:predicted amidohydrolase YtcJ